MFSDASRPPPVSWEAHDLCTLQPTTHQAQDRLGSIYLEMCSQPRQPRGLSCSNPCPWGCFHGRTLLLTLLGAYSHPVVPSPRVSGTLSHTVTTRNPRPETP